MQTGSEQTHKTAGCLLNLQTAQRYFLQQVMAQLSQACNCKTAQDTSYRSCSELVTVVDSYTREHQEKTDLVTGIRYAHIIQQNQKHNYIIFSCFFEYSVTNGLLLKIEFNPESSQICCSVLIHTQENKRLTTSAGPNQQPIVTTENSCLPLQETDPSYSGVMILNNCDILVQR